VRFIGSGAIVQVQDGEIIDFTTISKIENAAEN
jgi:hypothetical protein